VIFGLVLLVGGAILFGPWGGGDESCTDGPCDPWFVWKLWVGIAILVVWALAAAWFAATWIRDRRRR
jgi:hypothetical protein